jgi:hypothetical protein
MRIHSAIIHKPRRVLSIQPRLVRQVDRYGALYRETAREQLVGLLLTMAVALALYGAFSLVGDVLEFLS